MSSTTTTTVTSATPTTGRKPRASRAASVTVEVIETPAVETLPLDTFGLSVGVSIDRDTLDTLAADYGRTAETTTESGIRFMMALHRAIRSETYVLPATGETRNAVEDRIAKVWPATFGQRTAVRYIWLAAQETADAVKVDGLHTMAVAKSVHSAQARNVGINQIRKVLGSWTDATSESYAVADVAGLVKVTTNRETTGGTGGNADVSTTNVESVDAFLSNVKPETVMTYTAARVETILANALRVALDRLDVERVEAIVSDEIARHAAAAERSGDAGE